MFSLMFLFGLANLTKLSVGSAGVIEPFSPIVGPPPEKWLGGKTTIGAL